MSQMHFKVSSVAGEDRALFDRVVRLAFQHRELRNVLLPVIKDAARAIGLKKLRQLHEYRTSFAILSAYRPLSKSENKERHGELIRDLQKMGYTKWYDAKGYWTHTEKSVLVPGMSFGDAIKLGRKYDQEAIVYKTRDGIVGIYYLDDNTVQLAGPEVEMIPGGDEDAITQFRNTGLTYELYDERIPFRGPMNQKKLEQMGYLEKRPGLAT